MTSPDEWARALDADGVIVLPALDNARALATRLREELASMPEYLPHTPETAPLYALGGFGALGNPSSFHLDVVRSTRAELKNRLRPIARALVARLAEKGDDARAARLEALFDRVCLRSRESGAVAKEGWHRDVYDPNLPNVDGRARKQSLPTFLRGEGDVLLGGWINLSDADQYLIGLRGTHRDADARGRLGFAALDATTSASLQLDARVERQVSVPASPTDARGRVIVPPGAQVVIVQGLLHKVAPEQVQRSQARLFTGYRLTMDAEPLYDVDRIIDASGVPQLPSGQVPPMYSCNHYAFFSKPDSRFARWGAATFKPACLLVRKRKDASTYATPGVPDDASARENKRRCMASLRDYGFATYAYSEKERAAMHPELLGVESAPSVVEDVVAARKGSEKKEKKKRKRAALDAQVAAPNTTC